MHWQLAEAKNKFSEVVNRALLEGPQFITRRKDEVVLISRQEYEHYLTGRAETPRQSLVDFLLQGGPLLEELDLQRDKSPGRDVDFSE